MGVNGIYGLSGSGLDVESMVKAGMLSKQNQYDKMQQKYTKQQWEKEAFVDVYQDLTKYNYTTLSDYKLQKTTDAKQATSNNSAITATAGASAGAMTHKIEVNSMASNAYVVSTKSLSRILTDSLSLDAASDTSIKLRDVLFKKFDMNAGGTDSDGNQMDVAVVTTRRNDSITQSDNVSMSTTGFSITVSDGVTKDEGGNVVSKTISYTYQELYDGKTFNDLVSDINSLGLNVRATYDSVNDQFSFYNKQSGADNSISIKATTSDATSGTDSRGNTVTNIAGRSTSDMLSSLQLLQSRDGDLYGRIYDSSTRTYTDNVKMNVDSNGNMTVADSSLITDYSTQSAKSLDPWNVSATGTDASVKVDGISYSNLSGNKISVAGVTYEWTDKVESTAATVTVTQDTDKIVENVKKFVEDYNKLLSSLYEKYDEAKPDKTYEPLTETQKEGMKDEQIEKWEEKAKQGLLYHNSTIRKVIDRMRDSISTPIEGINSNYNTAYSIGISTTGLKGQLTLDEDKLRKALANDTDAAYNVIGRLSPEDDFAHNGLAQRLADNTLKSISDVKDYAGTDGTRYDDDSDLGNLMKTLKEKMDSFKTMMEQFEEALYKKYDAMEVALSQLGTQLSYITG